MTVQKSLIIYQFLPWLRNDVQMFKPSYQAATFCIQNAKLLTGFLLIFLRQSQTVVLVKDGVELWDCVVWTVVIVWVRSVSIRVLTGEWKVPAGNHAMCQLFSVTNGKWIESCSNTRLCSDWLRQDRVTVGNCVIWAIGSDLCDMGYRQCFVWYGK